MNTFTTGRLEQLVIDLKNLEFSRQFEVLDDLVQELIDRLQNGTLLQWQDWADDAEAAYERLKRMSPKHCPWMGRLTALDLLDELYRAGGEDHLARADGHDGKADREIYRWINDPPF